MSAIDDTHLGPWVYCKSHVGPHKTGWCTVSHYQKIALNLPEEASQKEANEAAWALGLPIYGYCDVCHKWVANEPWLYVDGRKTCPEHDE